MADTGEQDVLRSPHSAVLVLASSLRAGKAVQRPKLQLVVVGGGGGREGLGGGLFFGEGAVSRDRKRFLEGV